MVKYIPNTYAASIESDTERFSTSEERGRQGTEEDTQISGFRQVNLVMDLRQKNYFQKTFILFLNLIENSQFKTDKLLPLSSYEHTILVTNLKD